MNRPSSRDPLRDWLRSGDPAADGREPGATERAALRRRMLGAIPARPTAGRWLMPAAALVAAAALVLVIAPRRSADPDADVHRGSPVREMVEAAGPPSSSAPAPPEARPTEIVAELTGLGPDGGAPGAMPNRVAQAPGPPSDAADRAAHEAAPRRQQLQFATTNGTRVIWVLDSDLAL